MDSDGIPVAWTLQVVTVSSADKAEALRKQLLDMSQKAYIVMVRSNGKKLYRVCIGPKFERVELETLQASINAQFKVNSIVARYIP
jgi:DedD protein